jgi:dTDP-4-dehydrorhamnose reductase
MKIVIIGSGGRLGAAVARQFSEQFYVMTFDHAQLDLADEKQIRDKIGNLDFDILINTAAFTNVDLSEKERDQAFKINAEAPRVLAEIAREKKAKLIHFSTDYVFDGEKHEPYLESDPANPISVYGESKRKGEENVLAVQDRHLVVRVSWVFGPDRPSFIDAVIKRARESEHVDAIADKYATPTYTLDIAQMLSQFLDDWSRRAPTPDGPGAGRLHRYSGILHFANAGECSWQKYAQHAIDCCRKLGVPLRAKTVAPLKLTDMKSFIARRPVYSVLSATKVRSLTGAPPRSWRNAVAEYVRDFIVR